MKGGLTSNALSTSVSIRTAIESCCGGCKLCTGYGRNFDLLEYRAYCGSGCDLQREEFFARLLSDGLNIVSGVQCHQKRVGVTPSHFEIIGKWGSS